jgi:CHASE2 domain-containing sensor protein
MTRGLRVRMLVAVVLLAAAVAFAIEAGSVLDRLESSTVDARFGLRGERPVPSDVIVVGVDDKTFDEFGHERWPYSRNRFADVLENVSAGDPAVIVYDVQFT